MKLSKTQQNIIDKTNNGWALGTSQMVRSNRSWLQKGGLGRGGDTEDVSIATIRALLKKELLKSKYGFPKIEYFLANDK